MTTNKLQLPPILRALSTMVMMIVIVFFLIIGRGLLIPLFMGGFFAILFTPLSNWLESKKVPRVLSTIISLVAMIAVVAGLVSFVIGTVSNFSQDFDDVSGRINGYAEDIDEWVINNLGEDPEMREKANTDYLKAMLTDNSKGISDFALKTVGSLSGLVLIPVFMFFFLLYRDHLTLFMIELYKEKDQETVRRQIFTLRKLIQNYIVGVVKVMGILAVLNVIALTALGIQHAVFFGVIAAILNIIPYVGPFLGALMPIIFAFLTKDSLFYPLAVLGVYQLIQLIESNFLTPKIVGSNVNLNAFITFLALLVGGTIWGVAGMILIIPALAILREIFELSESTKPFALLMGEEKETKKEAKIKIEPKGE